MKRLLLVGFLVCVLCGAASSAMADDCKEVIARTSGNSYQEPPCFYGGFEYIWCVETRVSGNLNGTWYLYGAPEFNGWELTVPDDALGIDGWDLWTVWNLSVFETRRGEILAQGNDVLNLNTYFTYGAFSSTFFVIGGTGAYEGATGWLGAIGNEATGKGLLWGEVCIP